MSRFLSLSAFAAEVGWHQGDIEKLIAEKKIKAYGLMDSEPYIPKTELAKVREMVYEVNPTTARESHLMQVEADRLSRANSRTKIAAERAALESKVEKRRTAQALKRANREADNEES